MEAYRVRVSSLAYGQIIDYADYIATNSGSLDVADRWLDRVMDRIGQLNRFPQRYGLAEEDAHVHYEIRRMVIGNYLALYNIDRDTKTVRLIGFRHAARLPRPAELPQDPAGE